MGFRDRFYTPKTARAILSWRIGIGLAVGVALALLDVNIFVSGLAAVGAYAASIRLAMPREQKRPAIDPFVLSEPWRQIIQSAQGAGRKMRETIRSADAGPTRERLNSIADQLDRGLDQAWEVAKRGDEIDDAVRRLDPTALRARLAAARKQAESTRSEANDSAITSIENQIASADRLKQKSDDTATQLRLTQTKLDELVARASEVRIGVADTDSYANEVDDLVIQLEALHRAVEETQTS
jgi:hypothetical protein